MKNQGGKRTFYYAAVYRSDLTKNIIPVFQLFSEKHDIPSLSDVLSIFNRDLKVHSGSKNPVSMVTVDFSFALMNAVCKSFNDCSLFVYLELVYRTFVKKEPTPMPLTVIASCSVPVIKLFSDKLACLLRGQKKVVSLLLAK